MKRRIPVSELDQELLARMDGPELPPDFEFDGVSGWLDTFLAWDRLPAAAKHDFQYSIPGGIEDRLKADRLLFRNLKLSFMWTVPALAFYVAVRLCGWIHFSYKEPFDRLVDAYCVAWKTLLVLAVGMALVRWLF